MIWKSISQIWNKYANTYTDSSVPISILGIIYVEVINSLYFHNYAESSTCYIAHFCNLVSIEFCVNVL
jgi:hypothetical protein